jgi:pre-rRNA-processing protein TSR2
VSLSLLFWPALSLAVQSNFTSNASEIRDWMAGQIVELWERDPETEMIDVEERLLNMMEDEFETIVDDESAYEVAEQIMRLKRDCARGRFQEVEQLRQRWERMPQGVRVQVVEGTEQEDTDGDSDSEEDEDEDVEMGDAPPPKEKPAPEIDEDGFTKVVGKKKR